jgi:hypothetical protein
MSNFPLYNRLQLKLSAQPLSYGQKREFVKRVEKLDKEGHELIYAIIRTFQIENENDTFSHNIPYDGKREDKGLQFTFGNLPENLGKMLHKFSILHLKKMKDEFKRTALVDEEEQKE